MRRKLEPFNLGSRKQIGEYLIEMGWKPERFTPTNQPIVDEKTLSEITHIHEAKLIADFLLLQKSNKTKFRRAFKTQKLS